ncbi:MAG: helix-turn-helix domain-containing protein [Microbacterium ginsengisoli]|nr:helix-turn-helix domain-containing protein [Microbacterium ginsengisoli]
MGRLLTVDDVAERLQVAVKTVYQWRARKPEAYGPPAIKVGKYLRWKPEVVDAWIDAQEPDSNVTPIRQ